MRETEELIGKFYDGDISQRELERLFDSFLSSQEVREQWASEAEIIIPLALARKDAQRQTAKKHSHTPQTWRAAAAIATLLLFAGTATVYAVEARPSVYSTDSNCDMVCAEKWLNRTLETAL